MFQFSHLGINQFVVRQSSLRFPAIPFFYFYFSYPCFPFQPPTFITICLFRILTSAVAKSPNKRPLNLTPCPIGAGSS